MKKSKMYFEVAFFFVEDGNQPQSLVLYNLTIDKKEVFSISNTFVSSNVIMALSPYRFSG